VSGCAAPRRGEISHSPLVRFLTCAERPVGSTMFPMNLLSHVLQGTPIWVFALFGYLVWAGIRGLTLNVRKVSRVWITPAIFIVWGVVGLAMRSGPLEAKLLHWFIAALVGTGIGLLLRVPLEVDPQKKLVVQPGSVMPLIRNVAIFGAHYVLN